MQKTLWPTYPIKDPRCSPDPRIYPFSSTPRDSAIHNEHRDNKVRHSHKRRRSYFFVIESKNTRIYVIYRACFWLNSKCQGTKQGEVTPGSEGSRWQGGPGAYLSETSGVSLAREAVDSTAQMLFTGYCHSHLGNSQREADGDDAETFK